MEEFAKPFVIPCIDISHQDLFFLAYTDQLTQCYNRNMLEEFRKEIDKEVGQHLYVTILDFDGLKFINDIDGHAAGDAHLKHITSRLMKRAGVMFRLGGDEFLILNRNPIFLDDIECISYGTVSKLQFESLAESMKAADRLMYEMKRTKKKRKELLYVNRIKNENIGDYPK